MAKKTYILRIVPRGASAEGWTDLNDEWASKVGWTWGSPSDLVLLEVGASGAEREIDRKSFSSGAAASTYLARGLRIKAAR